MRDGTKVRVVAFWLIGAATICTFVFGGEPVSTHSFSPSGVQPRGVGTPFMIAVGGRALAPVVIAPGASAESREAAKTLVSFLNRITGAEFVIEENSIPRGVTVGTLGEFPDPSLSEHLAIREWNDGREAYAIRTGPDAVRLIGATDLGVAHAVYRFLELLGVRRYFAGQEWEIVPSKPDLAFDADEESRPAVASRRIWMAFGMGYKHDGGEQRRADHEAWRMHNRLGDSLDASFAHMYQNVYKTHKDEFDANRETYYALVNGKRDSPRKFCLANPRVRELVLDTAMAPLHGAAPNARVDMLSINPSDGGGWCECGECAALGSISDRAFGLANELAARLRKEGRTDVQVGIVAYHAWSDPPTFELDPLVHVLLQATYYNGRYDLPELRRIWRKKTTNLGLRDFFSTFVWGQERMRDPGAYAPAADPQGVADLIDGYIDELNIRSLSAESLANWTLFGPGYYVAAHKLWEPRSRVDVLLDDFYRNAFGAAAAEMRQFYELLYPSSGRMVNYDTLRRLHERLEAASLKAKDAAAALRRIRLIMQYMHSNILAWRRIAAPDEAAERKLWLDYYSLAWRTRETHMLATVPIFQQSLRNNNLLDLWNTPIEKRPWHNLGPLTDEETDERFQKDLDFLRSCGEPVTRTDFGRDWVLAKLPGNGSVTSIVGVGGGRLTLFSPDGRPLKVSLNLTSAKRPGRLVTYELLGENGKLLSSGLLEAQENSSSVHNLDLPVPAPGFYLLRIPDSRPSQVGFKGSLLVSAGAVVLEPDDRSSYKCGLNAHNLFVYVPKGTRELVAHVGIGKDVKLDMVDPDGDRHTASGVFGIARMAVPPGMDGKTWLLGNRQNVEALYFYTIPNVYSLDPGRALLPLETADADGLSAP